MLLGGWGPGARVTIERAARRSGMALAHEGPLTLAAPHGTLKEGQAGAHGVWVVGWMVVEDVGDQARAARASVAEAAAAAFERLGDAAYASLHGAYILVVRDRRRAQLRVTRDQLGARTLSYVQHGPDTFFAEHIGDLLGLLPTTPMPDRLSLVQWLDRRTLPLGRTLFSGIESLPAGDALYLSEAGSLARCYWRPSFREPPRASRSESAAALKAAAFAAVDRATHGLGRPAVKLSGGLDSACVAAGLSASKAAAQPLALAATFADYAEADESALIEQTARAAGLELIFVPHVDVPIFPTVLDYIRRWAIPPGSPNTALWQPLMAAAREHGVDGLLDGEGGDELFGVAPYLIADRLGHGRLLAAWRLAARLPGVGTRPSISMRLHVLRAIGVSGALPRSAQRLRRRARAPREGFGPLVSDADIPGLAELDETWSWKAADGPRWWSAAVDGLTHNADRLDASGELARNAIDARVDARHPFMHDVRLLEAVLAIEPEYQFDPVRDRAVLRDGLRGVVTEEVRARCEKSYFNELTTRPLAGAEGTALIARLRSPAAPVREYVRSGALEEITPIGTARGLKRHHLAATLFRVASVDCWLRHLGGGTFV